MHISVLKSTSCYGNIAKWQPYLAQNISIGGVESLVNAGRRERKQLGSLAANEAPPTSPSHHSPAEAFLLNMVKSWERGSWRGFRKSCRSWRETQTP